MESLIILIAVTVALTVAYGVNRFAILVDRSAAARLGKADQAAVVRDAFETVGSPLVRLIPDYFKRLEKDLYWAAFQEAGWKGRSPAWVVGRQVLAAGGLGVTLAWAIGSNLGLLLGAFIGWTLMHMELSGKAAAARRRISQELPEFLQLMAAESASGAGLETILSRAAQGEGSLPKWLRQVLALAHGRSLLPASETGEGLLRLEAERSGHPDLVSFAVQMGFARQGLQVRETLARLATQFSDAYIGQAEIRSEQLSNTLGVLVALFYFLPFLVVILLIVGVPVVEAF